MGNQLENNRFAKYPCSRFGKGSCKLTSSLNQEELDVAAGKLFQIDKLRIHPGEGDESRDELVEIVVFTLDANNISKQDLCTICPLYDYAPLP